MSQDPTLIHNSSLTCERPFHLQKKHNCHIHNTSYIILITTTPLNTAHYDLPVEQIPNTNKRVRPIHAKLNMHISTFTLGSKCSIYTMLHVHSLLQVFEKCRDKNSTHLF